MRLEKLSQSFTYSAKRSGPRRVSSLILLVYLAMARMLLYSWFKRLGPSLASLETRMAKMNARELAGVALTAAASMGMAPSAIAVSTWDPACVGAACTAAGVTMAMTAYSTNGAGSTFAAAVAASYGGGVGVTATGESTLSPQHAMDNFGSTDAILLNFSNSVILKQLTIG